MASPSGALERHIRCTFEDCTQTFATEKEMKKHKATDPEHEYCARCDEDFDFEEELMLHKIDSARHIACPICGLDFKSHGGKNAHIAQLHRTEQEIMCYGCKEKFGRAAALVAHLEGEFCPKVAKDEYKMLRVQKHAYKAAFERRLGSVGQKPAGGATATPSVISDPDGGVELNLLDDNDWENVKDADKNAHSAMEEAMESLGFEDDADVSEKPKDKGKDKASNPSISSNGRNGNDYPSDDDDQVEDLMRFSDIRSVAGHNNRNANPEASSSRDIPHEESSGSGANYTADWGKWVSYSDQPSESPVARSTGIVFDASQFYNSLLGAYVCECDQTFKTAKELEDHIHSGVHAGGVVRCPSCLRLFKTHTALVAHAESATKRCKISQTHNFGQLMDDLTGGVLEAVGYNQDGSVKFSTSMSMQKAQEKQRIDLDKVKW